ncbi:MAG: trypsin-like peptidase domain-containing protein [Acidimicrobiia bacterium]
MTDLGSRGPDPEPGTRDWSSTTAPVTQPAPPRRDTWTILLGLMGGVLLGTGITFAILGFIGVFEEPVPPTLPPPPVLTVPEPSGPPPTLGDSITATAVAGRVIPSTVFIESSAFLSGGSGSGVIYGEDGYILTNHHVIAGASDVAVIFSDGARFPATIVGSDPLTDVAVLRVERDDLAPIAIGSSDGLTIGEPAIAVGNPLGLAGGPTVTAGIVSALNRSLQVSPGETLYGLVQTDAPIAPGSSGGALIDAGARLIGITTAIAVSDVGAEGLGFAIPIDLAVGIASDLIENGQVDHARLGIDVETAWAQESGAEYPVGVGVTNTAADSAYLAGGGQVNDVIVEFGGADVTTGDDLLAVLRRHRAGDVVDVRILRGDGTQVLQIELGSLP